MLFGDLHRTQPLDLADATCSVLCATHSALGLIDATPAFSATARVGRPPVAPSLLPKITSDERLDFLGPAFSLRFKLIIKKRSLRERNDVIVLLIVLSMGKLGILSGLLCFARNDGSGSSLRRANGSGPKWPAR